MPDRAGTPCCSAIGLLCRQHLQGWKPDNARLQTALKSFAADWKPGARATDNCYQSYYVAQTLFHVGGDEWKNWHEPMRDRLVKSQDAKQDPRTAGSWYSKTDNFGQVGGRLMQTSLNVLILQTYYRHVPLHG